MPDPPTPTEPNLLAYLESHGWSRCAGGRWRHPDVPGDAHADLAYDLCAQWECLARDDFFDAPAEGDPREDPNDVNTRGLPPSHRA